MGKINYVCEFGFIHETANCRCTANHITKRQVKCDVPERHSKDRGTSKTLHERLEETVDGFFGAIIMPVVREAFVDKLEQDVKDWLLDFQRHDIKE